MGILLRPPLLTTAAATTASSKPACTSIDKTKVSTMHHVRIPYLPQEHKPAQLLGRLIHPPTNLNNKQWTVTKHGQWRRRVKMLNLPHRKGKGQGAKTSAKVSVNEHRKCSEDWEQVGEKTLPEAGRVVDHRDGLLNQRAPSKTTLHHKSEKQTVNCIKTQPAEEAGCILNIPQRKGGKAMK
jgi:hypothetical protein